MPLSEDFSGQNDKKIKFHCSNCGIEIITRFLKPGDILVCKSCDKETVVPDDAGETDQEPYKDFGKPRPSTLRQSYETSLAPAKFKEPEKSKEPSQWGFGSVIKFTLVYILSLIPLIIVVVILSTLIAKIFYPDIPVGEELYDTVNEDILFHSMGFIYYFVPIGLIYYSVVKRHKNSFFKALHIDKLSSDELARWLKICLAISIGLTLFSEFIDHLTPLGKFIPDEIPLYEIFKKGYIEVVWFSFFVLMAPIQEELIFRGYVYQGIKNKFGTITSAIIVSIVFVLLHGSQLAFNPILLFFIAVVAVLLIIVRIRTESLTKCILLHLVLNTVYVIYLWIWIGLFGLESLWS